ncbi:MAG TPA: hypothetical protein VFZ75_13585 [Actinomycetota bacterium]|nr:hypothetical protein [Actinomycetota bacterium]
MRRTAPSIIAVAVVVLSWPIICVGSSERSREWCQNAFGWPLPWSKIPGDGAGALMFAIPLVAAVAAFALTWAVLRRPRDRDATTSRS